MDSEYNDKYFLNQVDLNTNLLDNMVLQQVVMQPTRKPRSVGPHKSGSKTTTYRKKSYLKKKIFRSVTIQLRRGSKEPKRNGTHLLQQHLFYTNKGLKNYTFIDVGTFIPIITWKLTKNCSHIISDRPLSSCLLYYGRYQRSKHNDNSSSISIKDIELLYRLIGRLLFISKITRSNVQDCVISLLTTMKLSMNYHKNRNLKTYLLFMMKIWRFVFSSTEDQNNNFEA